MRRIDVHDPRPLMPTPTDPRLPIETLLPLHALVVTLQFTETSRPQVLHQAALTGFLRGLLGSPTGYDTLVRCDAPESGRVSYRAGDYYRFLVVVLAGGRPLIDRLIDALTRLPRSAPTSAPAVPLRDNCRLVALQDAFTEAPVATAADLAAFGSDSLDAETALWLERPTFELRWLAPARLKLPKARASVVRGEARYCRDSADLTPSLLLERLHDALADLLRRRGQDTPHRGNPPALAYQRAHLFWVDSDYRDSLGEGHEMGGLLGAMTLTASSQPAAAAEPTTAAAAEPAPEPESPPGPILSPSWWRLLVLGQYTGIGQRTAFGFGRYQLVSDDGGVTCRRPLPATSLLSVAADPDNLARAWRHVVSGADTLLPDDPEVDADLNWAGDENESTADGEDGDLPAPIERLADNLADVQAGRYQVPELRGSLLPKRGGGVRPLAVPPLRDRVLQRAVHQVLSPAIEALLATGAHGFRPGRSRITARHAIQAAWQAGYRWVYESDIRDFFDSVDLMRLRERLDAIFGDDPVVEAVIAWMAAPVRFQGQRIERAAGMRGLPQGAPLSPLMANLMLDDFDSDMQAAGFHLIRFADDFVVLCRDPDEAARAGEAARASLAEHGLALHPDKTRITAMDQGFRYLGYLFVNDLALDLSGAVPASQGGAEGTSQIPPASWLAALTEREPERLTAEDRLEALLQRIAGHAAVPIGEREDEGTLLCVAGDPCLIATRDGHCTVLRDDRILHHTPWRGLQAVILFGNHQLTTPAMHAALRTGVAVHLANGMGGYRGALWSGTPGEAGHQLWLRQIALFADPAQTLPAIRELIGARLRHMKETLRTRHQGWDAAIIDSAIRDLHRAENADVLRGLEGSAAREYYRGLAASLPEPFEFDGRNRQPPRDPVNALLSFGYTLLYGYSDSILRSVGLLPWKGFYHQGRGSHAALASDLMEPFRHVVERTAMTLLSRGELKPEDFSETPAGACVIAPTARRKFLALLIQRFETPVKALGAEEPERLFGHLRNQALSVRGWIDRGEPFRAWRVR